MSWATFQHVIGVFGEVFWLVMVVAFISITTRRLQRYDNRLRILELKTGWLQLTEGPGKRVEVVGTLGVQPVQATKDEDTPYAS